MSIEYFSNHEFIENGIIQASFRDLNQNWHLHRHQYYELGIILEGEGAYCVDNTMYTIRRGELFLMSPISFHSIEYSAPTKLISIIFALEACDVEILVDLFGVNSYIKCQLSEEDLDFISRLTEELCGQINVTHTIRDTGLTCYVKVLLNCVLAKIKNVMDPTHNMNQIPPMQYAMLYIHNHFKNPLTLESISKFANYSPNYFNYKFKEYTGVPFKQYLSDLRFTIARRLLETSEMSVAEIGTECGFRDASNFSLGFKKKYGVSPLHYHESRKKA